MQQATTAGNNCVAERIDDGNETSKMPKGHDFAGIEIPDK
jgi:hypothetical protein